MIWQRTRIAMLAALVLAGATLMAQAEENAPPEKLPTPPTAAKPMPGGTDAPKAMVAPVASDCGAPAMASGCGTKTVYVTEYRSESYQATRTVNKTAYRDETYTAYKEECVPETRTRTCTVWKTVSELQDQVVTKCVSVPTVENRTVTKKVTSCRPVTTVKTKCEDHGHWECQEVCSGPSLTDRLHKCFNSCYEPCPQTKSKKVWVACKVTVEVPCTKMEKFTECVTSVEQVTVCKKVMQSETVKVTVCKKVPECKTETYTVMVKKCVPYQATRKVCYTVPEVETYTACRMVPVTVAKEVAVASECNSCECSPSFGSKLKGMFSGLGGKLKGGFGCHSCSKHSSSSCDSCSTGCGDSTVSTGCSSCGK